jgi:hypothetical protein
MYEPTLLESLPVRVCSALNLAPPEKDADGGYALRTPDGLAVRFCQTREGVGLRGEVRILPSEKGGDAGETETLCRRLLTLSLGRARQECAASLPRLVIRGNALLLEDEIASDTRENEAEWSVERFLNLLEKWMELTTGSERRHGYRTLPSRKIILP